MIKPRTWQAKFLLAFETAKQKMVTLVATPRSGKTFTAIWSFILGRPERYDKMIVVGPTDEVRNQWVTGAATLGVQLCPLDTFQAQINPFDGLSMTYHQISSNIKSIQNYCRSNRVLIVLDEPHHLADKKSWGIAAIAAFKYASRVLSITGTPYRSDKYPIPFVRYEFGQLAPDFTYSYKEAVRDKVCRELKFILFGGEVEWEHKRIDKENGDVQTREHFAAFADDLGDQDLVNQRLKAALDPEKELFATMARQANYKLLEVRKTHKNAGGLAVCYDIAHAKKVAKLLESVTGEKPEVVTSDDDNGKLIIERFRNSTKKWIVSVKMVSEGVDIQRLRVEFFATNVKTSMNFRQITARVATIDGKHEGKGYVFLLADPDLMQHVKVIEKEIVHEIGDDLPLFGKKKDDEIEPAQYKYILETLSARAEGNYIPDAPDGKQIKDNASLAKLMADLRQDIKGLANKLAKLEGKSAREVHAKWLRGEGGKSANESTLEDLQAKKHWLNALIGESQADAFYTPVMKVF